MQRALMGLNLYGCEAVRHKLKNMQKMHFLCFLAIFELMSGSLATIQVEPHQCPLHQSILLTQEPICETFAKKKSKIGHFENLSFFESAILNFCFIPMKTVQIYMEIFKMRYFKQLFMDFQKITELAKLINPRNAISQQIYEYIWIKLRYSHLVYLILKLLALKFAKQNKNLPKKP